MKICDEMIKLRNELDKRGIPWVDKSSIVPKEAIQKMVECGIEKQYADCSMFRTHFTVDDYNYSVIYGYCSYGGYDPVSGKTGERLECMSEKINGGEPVGYMTAIDVLRIFDDKLDKSYSMAEDEIFAMTESIERHLKLISDQRGIELSEVFNMFKEKMGV